MAELTPQERLQPALLDRLVDDAPEQRKESRDNRVLSMSQLRECVLRDLAWLLNSTGLGADVDLDSCPQVASSVLNYGLPALSGMTASGLDIGQLELMLTETIRRFEPRILPASLRVRAVLSESEMNHNAIGFEIEGELWAQPVPLRLWLKTELDLESGNVRIEPLNG
ncbi:type VI secretion system baseplate subunit TssE [Plasticicumulans acidivorans]|uniref:Type VI secretion system protein ImpF n=1 Tax=Plasticicumulans acidivorans TaxID=886464 RepID=A0A317MZR0_9GAMM|nr:type VI secretion system baseplate subunit TssE [Plasticicumulans acidivorans]PWV64782.1 type VI secretion system protein ImpF [Plasticicumulans acidivorans]